MPDNKQRLAIQNAIVAVIRGVAGTANVFADQLGVVRASGPDIVVEKYVDQSIGGIQAWFVGRTATASDTAETKRGQIAIRHGIDRSHRFEIEGFYRYVSEESEPVWQKLCDDVISAFNNQRSLTGFQATPPQAVFDFKALAGHMCHHVTLTIGAVEKILGMEPT